jgi:hypothetical protein
MPRRVSGAPQLSGDPDHLCVPIVLRMGRKPYDVKADWEGKETLRTGAELRTIAAELTVHRWGHVCGKRFT